MKIAVSSDEWSHLVDFILQDLKERGYAVVYYGPSKGDDDQDWPDVTWKAVEKVLQGEADQAIIMCWTGTGCSIAANKMKGIRAALCVDKETAKGARIWNHANVLALSLRITTDGVAKEILDAWFETPISDDDWNLQQIQKLKKFEEK